MYALVLLQEPCKLSSSTLKFLEILRKYYPLPVPCSCVAHSFLYYIGTYQYKNAHTTQEQGQRVVFPKNVKKFKVQEDNLQGSQSKTKAYIVIRIPQISNGVMDLNMTSGKRSLIPTHLSTYFQFENQYAYEVGHVYNICQNMFEKQESVVSTRYIA